ncbi:MULTISPECIES: cold shock domain-containing protein [Planomicrobium]|uniref:Cold shock domain-containing protein n=1 Tax=Planomicrobium okeanokoites TaxID=244 RepID=A0ABV7KPZ2_PLAOK|nr:MULTISPECIES: cold shock domain-containing protein [Planomicrobium]PKH10087.1 cold-shock protein [Planomicrobium sp. MB-3u-38]TAA71184.1 cold shock domain-containing protein [Planomicrobium okeanokoites]
MSDEVLSGEGKVKWFDGDKGYGYITAPDGEEFFVETISINMDLGVLVPGQEVKFNIVEGNPERERIATNVTMKF